MFKVVLVVSAVSALNGALGTTKTFMAPANADAVQVFLIVWACVHLLLFLCERWYAELAYFLFLSMSFVVLAVIFDNVVFDPDRRIGTQFLYHAGLLFVAMLWLPFTKYVLFSTVTTFLLMGIGYVNLRVGSFDMWTAHTIPLVVHWGLSLLAAWLLERHYQGMLDSREKLARHRDRLEEEVQQRSKIIQEQQMEMMQTEKLQALGTLASGVAHDFNNMLTSILGQANLLKQKADPAGAVFRAADAIEQSALHTVELTTQLLGFARRGKLLDTAFSLHEVVRSVGSILDRSADKHIRIHYRLEADPCHVQGDPSQIRQVIMNLALNACHAMPEGGGLTFQTQVIDPEPGASLSDPSFGRFLLLSVEDTGEGIPEDIRHRLFEPFFTTREQGKGTGMGLAMSHGIVKNHGGRFEVHSTVGEGSTFKVFLPLGLAPAPPEAKEPQEEPLPTSGTGCILVVDDEEGVRGVLREMLGFLGYRVVSMGSGPEAVEYYAGHVHDIDLVILDMSMPGMDGQVCFRALKQIDPQVRTLLSTGHSLDGAIQKVLDDGALGFLQKPYKLSQLSESVASLIGPRSNPPDHPGEARNEGESAPEFGPC